jgi:Leucine-rich repeat (LRR) protein
LGHQNLSKAFIQARFSGHLKLQARGLTMLPPLCCNIGSVVLPEGSAWWETRETLETMDVSQNELISLPDELGTLEDLQQLDATNNRLRVLPPVLAELPALKKLMLAHNQLTQLPELGAFNLPPLVQLVASHNALTAVPPSFAGLIYLVELDLSHNRLGTLPSGLGGMRALKTLMLAKNELAINAPAVRIDFSRGCMGASFCGGLYLYAAGSLGGRRIGRLIVLPLLELQDIVIVIHRCDGSARCGDFTGLAQCA